MSCQHATGASGQCDSTARSKMGNFDIQVTVDLIEESKAPGLYIWQSTHRYRLSDPWAAHGQAAEWAHCDDQAHPSVRATTSTLASTKQRNGEDFVDKLFILVCL